MSSASVADTKNNLSSILASLASGAEREHVIRNRNTPVAVIKPFLEQPSRSTGYGAWKDDDKKIDWEAFDAMDNEIMADMGL